MIPKPIPCKASIAQITGFYRITFGNLGGIPFWSSAREVPEERPTVNHSRWLASFNAKCRNEEKRIATEKKKNVKS